MIRTSDGGFLISGYTESEDSASGASSILLAKLDASGNEEWIRKIGHYTTERAKAAIELQDGGGYLLTGAVAESSSNADVFVMRVDTGGRVVWASRYNGLVDYHEGLTLVESHDSQFVYFAGY